MPEVDFHSMGREGKTRNEHALIGHAYGEARDHWEGPKAQTVGATVDDRARPIDAMDKRLARQ
jgi:hypothetical protein